MPTRQEIEDWHKFLIHLALNIGPQTGINEDIVEEIKEEPAQEDGAVEEVKDLQPERYMTEPPAEQQREEDENLAKENSSPAGQTQDINEAVDQKSDHDAAHSTGGKSKASKQSNREEQQRAPSSKTPSQQTSKNNQPAEVPRAQVPKTEFAFGKAIPQTQTIADQKSEKSKQSRESRKPQMKAPSVGQDELAEDQ